jgi:hypothetical protein
VAWLLSRPSLAAVLAKRVFDGAYGTNLWIGHRSATSLSPAR